MDKWIPVSERLPEPHKSGKTFLVTDASGTIHFSKFYIPLSNSDITEPYWSGMIEVIAWMPLPEPYKAEKEWEINMEDTAECELTATGVFGYYVEDGGIYIELSDAVIE